MENKNLLLKGRTSIYAYVIIGCLGVIPILNMIADIVWGGMLKFSSNIYFQIFQIISSLLLIYYFEDMIDKILLFHLYIYILLMHKLYLHKK